MQITVGHTPDADDAFMFYGIAKEKVKSHEFDIIHVIDDIESLNKRAINHELDITAISAHAYAYLSDYVILQSGGSFGINYGPIVVSKKTVNNYKNPEDITIAIPGKMTSAALLLLLAKDDFITNFNTKEMSFDLIPSAVLEEQVNAGLVIHEAQITYDNLHLHKIFDLGSWWNKITDGLPVPLGINVASKRRLDRSQITKFDILFKKSIIYGLNNMNEAVDYAMQYSRGQSKELITKFVKMYVNEITISMGLNGQNAIKKLFQIAEDKGLISHIDLDFI
ncbi:MAG: ABC transporter substrate-binding protein [Nitrososphaeraceae archaeon]|nr:ABC transporter substrate-binding protein [Nitrososphaeraceae archaeon]